jgi:hypothetical protein
MSQQLSIPSKQPSPFPWANNPHHAADTFGRLANLDRVQKDYRQHGDHATVLMPDRDPHSPSDENSTIAVRLALLEENTATMMSNLERIQILTADLTESSKCAFERIARMEENHARRINKHAAMIADQSAQSKALLETSKAHAITISYLRARITFISGWMKSRLTIVEKSRLSPHC